MLRGIVGLERAVEPGRVAIRGRRMLTQHGCDLADSLAALRTQRRIRRLRHVAMSVLRGRI